MKTEMQSEVGFSEDGCFEEEGGYVNLPRFTRLSRFASNTRFGIEWILDSELFIHFMSNLNTKGL